MKAFFANRWVCMAVRVVLGAAFVYAGTRKMGDLQAFADNIAEYRLLPNGLISPLAIGLPAMEMLVGAMLIAGIETRLAAVVVLLMIAVFVAALGSALARGLNVDCGCFGSGSPSRFGMWIALGRDIVFGIMAWVICLDAKDKKTA